MRISLVSEHDLQVRVPVEDARNYQPQCSQAAVSGDQSPSQLAKQLGQTPSQVVAAMPKQRLAGR